MKGDEAMRDGRRERGKAKARAKALPPRPGPPAGRKGFSSRKQGRKSLLNINFTKNTSI